LNQTISQPPDTPASTPRPPQGGSGAAPFPPSGPRPSSDPAPEEVQGSLNGDGLRVAIVASRFHQDIARRLVDGAVSALGEHGVESDDIRVAWVPGCFEIPQTTRVLASTGLWHAVVCVGAVIKGETAHFEYVAGQAALGIEAVSRETGVPVLFGLLTTYDEQQALERAGGKAGNKGYDAALGAIEMVNLLRELRSMED
jgi:6,7-dimethyl-8-ribityllumazine synthase